MVGDNPNTQKKFMEALSSTDHMAVQTSKGDPIKTCCARRSCEAGKNNRVGEWLLLFIIGDGQFHNALEAHDREPSECTRWKTFAEEILNTMVQVGNIDPATLPGYNGNERPVPRDHEGRPEYEGDVEIRGWLDDSDSIDLWTGQIDTYTGHDSMYHDPVLDKIRTKMMDSMKQDAVSSHK